MSRSPIDIVKELLQNTLNPDVVRALVAPNATYVSLTFGNRDLKRIMPYAGVHEKEGPQGIIGTFATVASIWENLSFDILHIFGDDQNVAVFGRFTYRSTVVGREVTSPFAIMATVLGEKITYMQFMEDTFATAASFQIGGTAQYQSDPAGSPFTIVGPPSQV